MDTFNKEKRASIMRSVRSEKNKSTEIRFRTALKAAGIKGWRSHPQIAFKPDFIFPKKRIAVFIDGCFWHGCKKHLRIPKSNIVYWKRKIQNNIIRDKKANIYLIKHGWRVIRIWEHLLKNQKSICSIINKMT